MKKPEKARKKEKGEKTKQKLFASASMLFNKLDFKDVTVDRIVREAGVAKGTFYIYFESKDALIAAFISDYVDKVDMDYRTVLSSTPPDTPSSQILLGLIEKISDTLAEGVGCTSMRTVYKLLMTDNIGISAVKAYERDLYQIFAEVLERGMERGEFRSPLPANELIKHLVIAMRGLSYEWCIRYPDFDLKEQALKHFQILLDGIKSR